MFWTAATSLVSRYAFGTVRQVLMLQCSTTCGGSPAPSSFGGLCIDSAMGRVALPWHKAVIVILPRFV
jgi:hypothetical protein